MIKIKNGFTLVELLVVMTILSVLCLVSVPSYQCLMAKNRADQAVMQLYRAIQFAKSVAIRYNKVVTVCGSVDARQCSNRWTKGYMVFIDNRANGQVDAGDRIMKTFKGVSHSATLSWKGFPNKPYLQLMPTGFTNFQNGTFYYKGNKGDGFISRTLIIIQSGRMRFG